METNNLIELLARRAEPVSRLLAPWQRTALWLGVSFPYVGGVAIVYLVANGLQGPVGPQLMLEQGAILATGIVSAIAAFSSIVPGRDRRLALLPLIPLAVWLAVLGQGCLSDWLTSGAAGLKLRPDWDCALAAMTLSILPTLAMIVMLRRGAPLVPATSMALGALAVAAIVNFGLRLFHIGDLSIQVLAWHLGGAVVLAIAASPLGRRLLTWRTLMVRSGATDLRAG